MSADETSVQVIAEDGSELNLPADTVVQSVGFIKGVPFELPEDQTHIHLIGDANKVANLLNAVHNAYDLAMNI